MMAKDIWYYKANFCAPCVSLTPVFEALAESPEYQDINWAVIPFEEYPDYFDQGGIDEMPTIVFYLDDFEVFRIVGGTNSEAIKQAIATYFSSPPVEPPTVPPVIPPNGDPWPQASAVEFVIWSLGIYLSLIHI